MKIFSVITSVYKNDRPEYIRAALDSMLVEQTMKPNEIVLVQDEPVLYETRGYCWNLRTNTVRKLM